MKVNTFKRIYVFSIPLFTTAYIQFEFLSSLNHFYQFIFCSLIFAIMLFLMNLTYAHFIDGLDKFDQEKNVVNTNKIKLVRNMFFLTIVPVTLLLFFSPIFNNIRMMNNILITIIVVGTLVFSLFSAYIFINVLAFRKLSS